MTREKNNSSQTKLVQDKIIPAKSFYEWLKWTLCWPLKAKVDDSKRQAIQFRAFPHFQGLQAGKKVVFISAIYGQLPQV